MNAVDPLDRPSRVPRRILLDPRIPTCVKELLQALDSFAYGARAHCFPSWSKLAEMMGMHPDSVRRLYRRAKMFFLIWKRPRSDGNRGFETVLSWKSGRPHPRADAPENPGGSARKPGQKRPQKSSNEAREKNGVDPASARGGPAGEPPEEPPLPREQVTAALRAIVGSVFRPGGDVSARASFRRASRGRAPVDAQALAAVVAQQKAFPAERAARIEAGGLPEGFPFAGPEEVRPEGEPPRRE